MTKTGKTGTTIIVGTGPGLGAALAERFGRDGGAVGLIARRKDPLLALADTLRVKGIDACWHVADAADETALRTAIRTLEAKIGPCSTLIYNAAVLRPGLPLETDSLTVRAEFEVNVLGALVAAQSVAPGMIARGTGAILFTGGGLALEPYPEWTSLALGKSALRSLAFSLHKDLAPKGINVCMVQICGLIEPGGPFDPARIAGEYWRIAHAAKGAAEREVIYQPNDTDPRYNDPVSRHQNPPD